MARRTRLPMPGVRLEPRAVIALSSEAIHYLTVVRRLGAGAMLTVFDGLGHEAHAELIRAGEGWQAMTGDAVRVGTCGAPLTLCYGLPKTHKLEGVLRGATELGISCLMAIETGRSQTRIVKDRAHKRNARWLRVAEEASRQSGRADVPRIAGPCDLATAIGETAECATRWVLHPAATNEAADRIVQSPAAVFVGPEGGFAPQEVDAMTEAGVVPVRMGSRVLRTETAAVVACALMLRSMGEL